MLVRSSTLVVWPTMESVEIWAFGSISARLSGSIGNVQFVCDRNYKVVCVNDRYNGRNARNTDVSVDIQV